MQVEYRKEQMDTYLWISTEGNRKELFAEQMLLHNPGEGRLEFSRQQREGEEFFCYKITGKKALSSIYSAITIGERQIRSILGQLFQIVEGGREYLLAEENFLLAPAYIFATLPQMEIELCYVPGYNVPLKEQLESLFEYLLNRVDYEDRNAVELLYDCYMLCMREKDGFDEIKEKLKLSEQEAEKVWRDGGTEKEVIGEAMDFVSEVTGPDKKEQGKAATYFSWLTDVLFSKKKREVPLLADAHEEYHVIKQNTEVKRASEEKEDMEKTVLLATVQEISELRLVNAATGEVTEVSKFPFYIGSVTEYADYILKKKGVSRIHCCIKKKGECYALSDLNSTNGTFLDGEEVLPGKEELLSQNSVIRIADIEFSVDFPCH